MIDPQVLSRLLPHAQPLTRRWRRAGALFLFVAASFSAVPAQTPKPDPATIESKWQKAVSKYDAARHELLKSVDRQANEGPFRPEWESLQRYQAPAWYEDAKFGIFIHWGLYSVPAF